ncbi:MAG: hypothetical protein V1734_00310 [Nanoarchaeota archaeon]
MTSNFEGQEGVAYCESNGFHFAAARIAEHLGTDDMQRTAVRNYLKANKLVSAARVLTKLGDNKAAHFTYIAAVMDSLNNKDYVGAARIQKESGNIGAARQLYATAIERSAIENNYWQTAMIAEEAGNQLEARAYRELAKAEANKEETPEII